MTSERRIVSTRLRLFGIYERRTYVEKASFDFGAPPPRKHWVSAVREFIWRLFLPCAIQHVPHIFEAVLALIQR